MENQRGLVSLEIILVVLIIAILSTIALPKMARIVDKAQLDYEMKMFLSTLDFGKTLSKTASYNTAIFERKLSSQSSKALLLNVDYDASYYELMRGSRPISEKHHFPAGFSIIQNYTPKNQINFSENQNGNITLTSRFGDKRYIIFDSVGRWRGDNKPPQ